ncbi:MerR family transcriptional regulator [Streptomyces piniterrae]|uniref:MerR family transcriptional regulator n=1 Tax=Streptomyces piniterrae TaxID=2571125 RepID=A0A4U0MP82_9ACTN|nr:MerR family transcriptional regulator [Streptomyces piniterrae]
MHEGESAVHLLVVRRSGRRTWARPRCRPTGRRPEEPRPDGQDRCTISEVAAFTGLRAHTLRWYEQIGPMPDVERSHTGRRRFGNRDLDWPAFVRKLRLTGMPVADMVRFAELVRGGEVTFDERREILQQARRDVVARLAELQDTLACTRSQPTMAPPRRRSPWPGCSTAPGHTA